MHIAYVVSWEGCTNKTGLKGNTRYLLLFIFQTNFICLASSFIKYVQAQDMNQPSLVHQFNYDALGRSSDEGGGIIWRIADFTSPKTSHMSFSRHASVDQKCTVISPKSSIFLMGGRQIHLLYLSVVDRPPDRYSNIIHVKNTGHIFRFLTFFVPYMGWGEEGGSEVRGHVP